MAVFNTWDLFGAGATKDLDDVLLTFNLYRESDSRKLIECLLNKPVADVNGRHIGYVSDVMVSSWNNAPEYLVIDAKIKPWHIRSDHFYYPIGKISKLSQRIVRVQEQRSEIYEGTQFDPSQVEREETFPLLSLKAMIGDDMINKKNAVHVLPDTSDTFWHTSLL